MQELLLFFVGMIIGVMNAIAGGGMLIGFPVLLATGMPAIMANATSSIIVMPGLISSTYAYRKYLRRIPRSYLLLLIPATVGSAVGALILRNTSFDSFERLIPWLILMAVMLFAFQPLLYIQLQRHLHGPKKFRTSLRPILVICLALLPLAVYGGYFGAGFGFIMLAFLGFTKLHDHIHRMTALKNITCVFINFAALACLFTSGLISWRQGLIMAAGNFIGGYYGAIGSQKISSHSLRIIVIVIGLGTATYLGLRSY